MNERDLAERIASHLDRGLDDLAPGTVYRLRLAREKALSQLRDGLDEAAPGVGPSLLSRRLLVPLFAVIVTLSGLVMWQHTIQNTSKTDLAELDAQVLSDELPVTAYLDQGFEVWLHHPTTE